MYHLAELLCLTGKRLAEFVLAASKLAQAADKQALTACKLAQVLVYIQQMEQLAAAE